MFPLNFVFIMATIWSPLYNTFPSTILQVYLFNSLKMEKKIIFQTNLNLYTNLDYSAGQEMGTSGYYLSSKEQKNLQNTLNAETKST